MIAMMLVFSLSLINSDECDSTASFQCFSGVLQHRFKAVCYFTELGSIFLSGLLSFFSFCEERRHSWSCKCVF